MIHITPETIKVQIPHPAPGEQVTHYRRGLLRLLQTACHTDPAEFAAMQEEMHDVLVLLEHLMPPHQEPK